MQLPAAIRARAAFRLLDPPLEMPDVRGIWIYGPPGVGKSHYVREQEPVLFNKSQNKWWDGYQAEPAALIDDFDPKGDCLSHVLKIWADKYACTGEIKGGTVPLNFRWLYVTSNYTIEEIFKDDKILQAALLRRFRVVCFSEFFLGKRSPLN